MKKNRLLCFCFAVMLCLSIKAAPVNAFETWMRSASKLPLGSAITKEWHNTNKVVQEEDNWDSGWQSFGESWYIKLPVPMSFSVDYEQTGDPNLELSFYKGTSWRENIPEDSDSWDYDPENDKSSFKSNIILNKGINFIRVEKDLEGQQKVNWSLTVGKKGSITTTPAIKTLKKKSKTSVKLTMKPLNGATGYYIYMRKGKKGAFKRIKILKGTSFVKKGLKKKNTYQFKVRSYVKIGNKTYLSPYSSVKKIYLKK